jgi:hypothetical protein
MARLWTPRVALPLAFVLTAAWLAWQASHVNSFIWLIDELLYMKYAVSYSDFVGLMPAVHGQAYGAPNLLYPVLISPLFWVLSTPDAFKAAHIVNGALFASAMFPVYLTCRRIGASWSWSLLGGLVAVWVPWSVASLVLMTEATAYPLFAWAVFASTVAIVDPRPRNEVLALVVIGLAVLARTQLVFLVVVFPLAVVLWELSREGGPPLRERLRSRIALVIAALVGAALVALVQLAGGNLLGSYEITTTTALLPGGLWDSMMVHVSHMIIGVTVVPAVMWGAWMLIAGMRPLSEAERAGAIVSGLAFAATIYQAGWFARTIGGGVFQERYTIYVAALFAVGLAVLGSRPGPAPRVTLLVATFVAAIAIAGSQFGIGEAAGAFGRVASAGAGLNEKFAELQPDANSVVPGRDRSVAELAALFVLLAGLAVTVAFSVGRRARVVVAAACVLALIGSVAQTRWLFPKVITGIAESYPAILAGVDQVPRDWVDQRAPDGAKVGMQPGRIGQPDDGNHWMWTEFWNKRITREYTLAGTGPFTGWPGHKLEVDPATGNVKTGEVPDVLVIGPGDPTLRLSGRILSTVPYGAALLEPAKPLHAEWRMTGSTFDGAPGSEDRRLQLSVFRPSRKVAITLAADTAGPENPDSVRFAWSIRDEDGMRRGKLRSGGKTKVVVHGSRVTIELPALKLAGGNDGTVRVLRIDPA